MSTPLASVNDSSLASKLTAKLPSVLKHIVITEEKFSCKFLEIVLNVHKLGSPGKKEQSRQCCKHCFETSCLPGDPMANSIFETSCRYRDI